MARAYGKRLNASLAIIDKRRPKPNQAEVMNVIGDIGGKNCLIIDDEINTGGTIINAVKALKARGAKDVFIACVHPVFAGQAVEKLSNSSAKEVVTTNTIFLPKEKRFPKLKIVSVAKLLAQAIAEQLAKRMPFRRVIKQVMDKAKEGGVKGIKISVSGRLDSADMSRREWLAWGQIPLHTLRADIDFAQVDAPTPVGLVGVKVWIYHGEKFRISEEPSKKVEDNQPGLAQPNKSTKKPKPAAT